MDAEFYHDKLFPILRAGLDLPAELPELSEEDYAALETVGRSQAVLPVIYHGLKRFSVANAQSERLYALCNREIFHFLNRDLALEQIMACLEKEGIRYLPLKGAVIRELYPEPWMRTSCDIDVLIPEAELDRAVAALERDTEFRDPKRRYHDVSMVSRHVHLELHFSIRENLEPADRLLAVPWDYAVQLHGARYAFTPEYQLFHVLAHMAYHFLHGGLGVRPYLDLWLLQKKTRFDEQKLRQLCQTGGLLRFYDACSALAAAWLEGGDCDEVSAELEAYCFDGGVFGSAENQALAEQRGKSRIGYVARRLFLKKDVLKEMYPTLKKYPFLLPYYELRRWPRAITSRRKQVAEELRTVRNTPEEQTAKFDRLMKQVGL